MKKIKWQRVFIVALTCTIIGAFQSLYDHVTINSQFTLGPSSIYQLRTGLILNLFSGFTGGFIAGLTLNYIDDKYRTKPYYQGLIIIILVFVALWSIRNITEAFVFMRADSEGLKFPFDALDVRNIIFWIIVVILAYFFLQMGNKFGPGKLFTIFTGKYNVPKEEKRIFMFLDLTSSTTIAERLGGVQYHLFLKELFSDLTTPILNHEGEIYQYVGDEIVMSWEMKNPKNLFNYIHCFFAIQEFIDKQEKKYLDRFGVKPRFKAGAHCGAVIAGEVGVIKRDISYSGDVLNTAARIQAMCNELNSCFLISDSLFSITPSIQGKLKFEGKGKIYLKGKKEPLELLSIS